MQSGVEIITKDIESNIKIKQDFISCFIFLKKFAIIYIEKYEKKKGRDIVYEKTK